MPDRRTWIVCLALALGTFALFAPVLGHDFVNFDDDVYVTENSKIQGGLTGQGVVWAFTTDYACNWHPLTWLSHMLDCQIYGLKPAGHHLTSLVLHVVNVLLLFGLLHRMTGAPWRSALVAALFAWHPLHVESVAWVSERKDVLSTLFWLLTMLAYVRYVKEREVHKRKAFAQYCLALLFFALGLMSKPMLVTLPFALLLLDFWPLARNREEGVENAKPRNRRQPPRKGLPWKRLVLEKLPFFALALGSSLVTVVVQKSGGAIVATETFPLPARAVNAVLAYGGYLRKMVWPSDLAVFYPYAPGAADWRLAVVILLLCLVTGVSIFWHRRRPWLLVGWLWFLGTLVPVLGLVQVGSQALADRYTYVPLVGMFIFLTWGVAEILEPLRSWRIGCLAATLVLIGCMVVTQTQVRYWKNSEKLFSHAIAVTANNLTAHENLGRALDRAGKPAEAEAVFKAALQLHQGAHYSILNDLGVHYAEHGDLTNAVHYFNLSLAIQPLFGQGRNNLGNALASQGKLDEAIAEYTRALRDGYDAPDIRKNFGSLLARMGQLDAAAVHLKAALQLKPDYAEARYWLGEVLLRQGRVEEAVQSYREAIRLKPDWPVPLGALAWVLATNPKAEVRNGPEAVRLAERACSLLKAPDLRYLSSLDAAYAEAGRFEDALRTAAKVQQLAIEWSQKGFGDEAARRIALYRVGKPFHE